MFVDVVLIRYWVGAASASTAARRQHSNYVLRALTPARLNLDLGASVVRLSKLAPSFQEDCGSCTIPATHLLVETAVAKTTADGRTRSPGCMVNGNFPHSFYLANR